MTARRLVSLLLLSLSCAASPAQEPGPRYRLEVQAGGAQPPLSACGAVRAMAFSPAGVPLVTLHADEPCALLLELRLRQVAGPWTVARASVQLSALSPSGSREALVLSSEAAEPTLAVLFVAPGTGAEEAAHGQIGVQALLLGAPAGAVLEQPGRVFAPISEQLRRGGVRLTPAEVRAAFVPPAPVGAEQARVQAVLDAALDRRLRGPELASSPWGVLALAVADARRGHGEVFDALLGQEGGPGALAVAVDWADPRARSVALDLLGFTLAGGGQPAALLSVCQALPGRERASTAAALRAGAAREGASSLPAGLGRREASLEQVQRGLERVERQLERVEGRLAGIEEVLRRPAGQP